MTLEEIAAAATIDNTLRAPAWALGCVERRSITFATGAEDTRTCVYWVQAHGMTGDIRIHPARPRITPGVDFATLDRETLALLASVEGGIATTSWASPIMSWSDWIGFQPYDKFPEPGVMHRVGDCMVEFAPSGAYVEDWRFLQSAPGLLGGLRLESETDTSGRTYPRAGGLVVAGDHAIRTLARRDELLEGTRAQDFVRSSTNPAAALERIFDCVTDYMIRNGTKWVIQASTDPRRERAEVALIGCLTRASHETVCEDVTGTPGISQRHWRIDSLEAGRAFPQATPLAPDRLAWLDSEADTLLDPIGKVAERKVA
jgi:hypothetical protein